MTPPVSTPVARDMVERVARVLADKCHCGCTYGQRLDDAKAALEASHHAELVEALNECLSVIWKWCPRENDEVRIVVLSAREALTKIGEGYAE